MRSWVSDVRLLVECTPVSMWGTRVNRRCALVNVWCIRESAMYVREGIMPVSMRGTCVSKRCTLVSVRPSPSNTTTTNTNPLVKQNTIWNNSLAELSPIDARFSDMSWCLLSVRMFSNVCVRPFAKHEFCDEFLDRVLFVACDRYKTKYKRGTIRKANLMFTSPSHCTCSNAFHVMHIVSECISLFTCFSDVSKRIQILRNVWCGSWMREAREQTQRNKETSESKLLRHSHSKWRCQAREHEYSKHEEQHTINKQERTKTFIERHIHT